MFGDGFPTRDRATYNCPCEKHGCSRSNPYMIVAYPCDLFTVITNAKRIGNSKRLNGIDASVSDIVGTRDNKASVHSVQYCRFDYSNYFCLITPLQSLDAFMFRNKMRINFRTWITWAEILVNRARLIIGRDNLRFRFHRIDWFQRNELARRCFFILWNRFRQRGHF